jgi:hypothetical protein
MPLAAPASKLTFLQISDSHIGFDKPANPNVIGTAPTIASSRCSITAASVMLASSSAQPYHEAAPRA